MYYIQPPHPPKMLVLTRPTTHSLTAATLRWLTPLPGAEPNQSLSKVPRGTENETHTHTHKGCECSRGELVSVNTLRLSLALCQDSLRRIFSHKSQSAVNPPRRLEVSHKDTAREICPRVKIKQTLTAGGQSEIKQNNEKEWGGQSLTTLRHNKS